MIYNEQKKSAGTRTEHMLRDLVLRRLSKDQGRYHCHIQLTRNFCWNTNLYAMRSGRFMPNLGCKYHCTQYSSNFHHAKTGQHRGTIAAWRRTPYMLGVLFSPPTLFSFRFICFDMYCLNFKLCFTIKKSEQHIWHSKETKELLFNFSYPFSLNHKCVLHIS